MRGRTAQMSLLTLCHLSVTSPIQSSSNQTAEAGRAAREAERDKVGQGLSTRSRPGIMYMYVLVLPFVQILFFYKRKQTRSRWMLGILFRRCYAKNTRKRKCSKKTGQEGWGRRTAASGLNE